MATYKDKAEAIADRIRSLPDAGVVHIRPRYTDDWASFIEQFRSGGRLCGWMVTRREADEGEAANHDVETWHLVGLLAVSDADESGLVSQQRVDDLRDSFRADPTLPVGVVARVPKLVDAEERWFGGVLCHCADVELVLVVR